MKLWASEKEKIGMMKNCSCPYCCYEWTLVCCPACPAPLQTGVCFHTLNLIWNGLISDQMGEWRVHIPSVWICHGCSVQVWGADTKRALRLWAEWRYLHAAIEWWCARERYLPSAPEGGRKPDLRMGPIEQKDINRTIIGYGTRVRRLAEPRQSRVAQRRCAGLWRGRGDSEPGDRQRQQQWRFGRKLDLVFGLWRHMYLLRWHQPYEAAADQYYRLGGP